MPGFAGIVYLSSLKTVTQPDSNALPINQTENIMWNLVDSTGSGSLIPFIGTSVDSVVESWVIIVEMCVCVFPVGHVCISLS